MATIDVSIPENMKLWVEQQANSGGFAKASDYIRHLIRCERSRKLPTFRHWSPKASKVV